MKFKDLIGCFYPNKCAACGEIIGEDTFLCQLCSRKIQKNDLKEFCIKCGAKKENCRCKSREFHFSGCVSTYENTDIAKKAYYSYKILRQERLADFFALQLAETVKSAYNDLEFDGLFCVPTVKRSVLKRGFDHNKLIAKRLADILNIPFIDGVIKSKHFVKPQHKSSYAKRLENVRDKYYTVKRINCNRVLLFDDICTSGATLDQCAKELLFAGADEVYCVTVLSVAKLKKE